MLKNNVVPLESHLLPEDHKNLCQHNSQSRLIIPHSDCGQFCSALYRIKNLSHRGGDYATVPSHFDGRAWVTLCSTQETCTMQTCRKRKSVLAASSTRAGSSTTNVQPIIGACQTPCRVKPREEPSVTIKWHFTFFQILGSGFL